MNSSPQKSAVNGQSLSKHNAIDKTVNFNHVSPSARRPFSVVTGGLSMHKAVYEVDDICFIRLPGFERLFRGRVAAHFTDPGVTGTYYIIKLDNFTWPQFEIRDSSLMSADGADILPAVEHVFNPALQTSKTKGA